MCKIYTSLLNNRIVNFCEEFNVIVDEQNGFRRSRSCEDHLFGITSIVRNRINRKISTLICKRHLIGLIGTCYLIDCYCICHKFA